MLLLIKVLHLSDEAGFFCSLVPTVLATREDRNSAVIRLTIEGLTWTPGFEGPAMHHFPFEHSFNHTVLK